MRIVNIIHLSDIHFDNSDRSLELLDALEKDLLKQKEELNDYHLFIITGDTVNQGRVDLYEAFSQRFNKLLSKCGISKKRVIIAVGNHDVDLKNPWLLSYKKDKEQDKEIIDGIMGQMTPLYTEYNKFCQNYRETPNGIGVINLPIKNSENSQIMRLRIIVLNSSWSTAIHNKYGELVIGENQLEEVKRDISKSKIKKFDYTLLCMHHPMDWLLYEERAKLKEFMEKNKVDFFLHGHIHESDVRSLGSIDGTTNSLCTGISYAKTGEKTVRKSGMRYSIYQINNETNTMNVYIRSTNEKGSFVEDNTLYSNVKNGFFTIPLENYLNCLMPFNCVDRIPKSYAVLTNDNVKKILSKEAILFQLYTKVAEEIETKYKKGSAGRKNAFQEYKAQWQKRKGYERLTTAAKKECEIDFADEQFGEFCLYIIMNLNALFFHGNVRFLIRRYNKETNEHEAFVADGPNSNKIEEITNFKWKTGLIYQSFKKQQALLQSANMKYYKKGKTNHWINALTMVVDGIAITRKNESIPLLSLNIAISSEKDEACLEALALSSIYEKVGAIFGLYNEKADRIDRIIYKEDM